MASTLTTETRSLAKIATSASVCAGLILTTLFVVAPTFPGAHFWNSALFNAAA